MINQMKTYPIVEIFHSVQGGLSTLGYPMYSFDLEIVTFDVNGVIRSSLNLRL